jgi:hypothetical protein
MKKPSNRFFKILFEAIKKRNPYGIDKQSEDAKQLFFKPYDQPDYSYRGAYSAFKPQRGQDFLIKNKYAELRKQRAKVKGDIKNLESKTDQPTLFDVPIESKHLAEMQIDMKGLTHEIDAIKKVKQESSSYTNFLRKILTSFFTVPGATMAKRYIFLPLKRNFNMTQITALNKKSTISANMLQDLFNKHEVVKDKQIDADLIRYLKSVDYEFKSNDDLYNNICYTKKGAKVKISDELQKIEAISIVDKERALKNSKDIKKDFFIQREIDKKRGLKPEFIKRMDIIESEIFQTDKPENINMIVLTWVPRMIMSQSTDTIWRSCMSLPSAKGQAGTNVHFVKSGIENGVFIAWLVNIDDIKNIDKPKARILIKPFRNENGYVWLPSRIYHDGSVSNDLQIFKQAINTFCFLKQKKVLINAAKRESRFNVDYERVYQDTDDANKKIFTLKEIFKKIEKSESMSRTKEVDIYDAADFTTIKAMAYLKKIKKETLLRNIHSLMSNTLKNQNITVFNYLADISEKEAVSAVNYYFSDIVFERNYQTKESFFSFLVKYYFDKIELDSKHYLLSKLFESGEAEKINYFIKSDPSVFFDKKHKKKNLYLISKIIMNTTSYEDTLDISFVVKFIDALMKKIKISDYFDLNETLSNDTTLHFFTRMDSTRLTKLSAENEKIWKSFIRELENTNSSNFMLHYIKSLTDEYFESNQESLNFKSRYLDYVKRLSDKNLLTDDFFENIISYVIQGRKQVVDIINIVKTKFEVDDVTPINLAINIELEQKEFEKNMNIIFAKNKNVKLFKDLLDTFHSKFSYLSNLDYSKIDFIKEKIIDAEKKLIFVLNNHDDLSLDKSQLTNIMYRYIDLPYSFNKELLIILGGEKTITGDIINDYIGSYYFKHLESLEMIEMFKNKILALMNVSGKKTLNIKPNSYVNKIFFGFNSNLDSNNERVNKLLDFFYQIFDFKQIVSYIIKKVKNTKTSDVLKIREQKEAINNFYFDLKNTKIVEEFTKSKEKLDANFMQNTLIKTISKNFSTFLVDKDKLVEDLLKDKQLCKNIRDFFRNDFDYAIKTIVDLNMTLENKNYYQCVNALRIAFNFSEEDFLEMPIFKLLLKKPSERIFGFLPKADKQNLEKYIIKNIDEPSIKQKMRLQFIKYIENEKEYMDLGPKKYETQKKLRDEVLQFYNDLDFSIDNDENNLNMTDNILIILSRNNFKDIDDIEGFTKRTVDIINNKFDKKTEMDYEFHMEFYNLKDSYVEAIEELNGEKEKRFRKAYHDYLHAYLEKYLNFCLRNSKDNINIFTKPSADITKIDLMVSTKGKLRDMGEKTIKNLLSEIISDKFKMIKINFVIE